MLNIIKQKIILRRILVLAVLLTSNLMFSDPPPPFDDDVQDVPASIDNNLIYLGILAIGLALYMIKKNKKSKSNYRVKGLYK